MTRLLKHLAEAGALSQSLAKLEKRLDDLKRLSEREIEKLKEFASKSIPTRQQLNGLRAQNEVLAKEVESLKILCGRIASENARRLPPSASLREAEFQVFSQWGEDGIIQFLLAHVPVAREIFVEFGVQDYAESNTRFLLMNNLWSGLIMDGSEDYMKRVNQSRLAWRHTLKAKAAWITAENVNDLILDSGIQGDIGLLSIDIDGVDYWVWKAIQVVQPRIVIAEYNSLFGPNCLVTPVYAPDFDRGKAHYSHVFYGPSLAALEQLGKEKGFSLIGTNSAGNNAFFVRKDLAGSLPVQTSASAFQAARFREARLASGELAYSSFADARNLIADCVVHDLSVGRERALKDVPGWIS
ncbi:MAG: hypothetical protein KGS60_04005 [Verrucomicrobia bacterium]|nr:hypothetical protein [Verrucomicrobiota bacterium]